MIARALVFAKTLGLSLVVYMVALACHEVMHLVALYALGGQGTLIVRGYRFTFLPITVDAFHVQPAQPLALLPHLVFDFAGPALAAVLLGLLMLAVHDRVPRTALLANLAVLGFYALIEPLDLILDGAGVASGFLLWAEFNYGVPLLLLLGAAVLAARLPGQQDGKARPAGKEPAQSGPDRRVLDSLNREPGAGQSRA